MPDTVKSLKLENEELKTQVNMLRKEFKNLEATLDRRIAQSNDTKDVHSSISNETSKSLDFLSNGYDELSSFRCEAKNEFAQLNKKLDNLTTRVDEIGKAIDNIERYSYQYNVKIIGIPELKSKETAQETSNLCVKLFQKMGVDITSQDIDIAHRVPSRNPAYHKPIICKFTRRCMKEQVMIHRQDANKIEPTVLGLPSDASILNARVYDHLTPKVQKLLTEAKKFQQQYAYRFCWIKNSTIYLRKAEDSRPIIIKKPGDLQDLAGRQV